MSQSLSEQIASIVDQYRASGLEWPASTWTISQWALNNGKADPLSSPAVAFYSRMIGTHLREKKIKDPQGRLVRQYHAVLVSVDDDARSVWADIETISRADMANSARHRIDGIIHDCLQLKSDVDSYNQNYNTGKPIQICLDFSRAVAEIEAKQQVLSFDEPAELTHVSQLIGPDLITRSR